MEMDTMENSEAHPREGAGLKSARSPRGNGFCAARKEALWLQDETSARHSLQGSVAELQSRNRELEGVLSAKEAELMALKHQTNQLTNDFLYNLKLLEQRDKQMDSLESNVEELKMSLAAKDVLLTKSQQHANELEVSVAQSAEQRTRMEEKFQSEIASREQELLYERHKMRDVVSEMQTAVQDAQSKFSSDLQHERKVASEERESLLADYQAQVEKTRKSDLLVADLRHSLDLANKQVVLVDMSTTLINVFCSKLRAILRVVVKVLEQANQQQTSTEKLQGAVAEIKSLEAKHCQETAKLQNSLHKREEHILDLEGRMEEFLESTNMKCEGLQDRIGKSNEKIRRLRAVCEEQSNQIKSNANQLNPLSEENRHLKKKLLKVQEEIRALKESNQRMTDITEQANLQNTSKEAEVEELQSKLEDIEEKLKAKICETDLLKSELDRKKETVGSLEEKVCKLENRYAHERQERCALQKQVSTCLHEKENHHKQKMHQVLLDLKKERSDSSHYIKPSSTEIGYGNPEQMTRRSHQDLHETMLKPAPFMLSVPTKSSHKNSQADSGAARGTRLPRCPEWPLDEEADEPPTHTSVNGSKLFEKDESEGILLNTLNMLHNLAGTTEENLPRSPHAAQTRCSRQLHEYDPGQNRSKVYSRPTECKTQDKELERAIRKLKKERKKLVEKQLMMEKNNQLGPSTSQFQDKNQLEFLAVRAEQLSEENGRLRCQLAAREANVHEVPNPAAPQPSTVKFSTPTFFPRNGSNLSSTQEHTHSVKLPDFSIQSDSAPYTSAPEIHKEDREFGLASAHSKIKEAQEYIRRAAK